MRKAANAVLTNSKHVLGYLLVALVQLVIASLIVLTAKVVGKIVPEAVS